MSDGINNGLAIDICRIFRHLLGRDLQCAEPLEDVSTHPPFPTHSESFAALCPRRQRGADRLLRVGVLLPERWIYWGSTITVGYFDNVQSSALWGFAGICHLWLLKNLDGNS